MSAPMVTGFVATMLDKDKMLNTSQVRAKLTALSNTRKGVDPAFNIPEYEKTDRSALG